MFKLTVEVSDTLMDELIFALHHADGHSLPELYMLYTKMVKLKNEYLRDIHLTDAEGTLAEVSGQHVERERIGDHE